MLRGRTARARHLVALLFLSAALVSSAALASAPRGASPPEIAPPSPTLERALASDELSGFALGLDSLDDPPQRFAPLAGVELAENLAQDLRQAEPSYPKTRIGGLRLFEQDLYVVSTSLNVDVRWGCGDFSCGIAEDIGVNLYAYVGQRPHEKTDPLGLAGVGGPVPCPVPAPGHQCHEGTVSVSTSVVMTGSRKNYVENLIGAGVGTQRTQSAANERFPISDVDKQKYNALQKRILPLKKPVEIGTMVVLSVTALPMEAAAGPMALIGSGSEMAEAANGLRATVAASAEATDLSLPVLSPHFTPDPTRVLENIARTAASDLAANPALARTVLSPAEYASAQNSLKVAPMQFGNAVERLSAQEVANDPLFSQVMEHVGGPRKPDFVGRGFFEGMNFDITTRAAVKAHLARPGYGTGLNIATYQRPAEFTLFPP